MRTVHRQSARVEADHVHQVPHAQLLAGQRDRGPAPDRAGRPTGVEEQLGGVVAGLTVDLHQPGEVRRPLVVQPVVIREPRVRLGDQHEFTGPGMVEAARRLAGTVQHRRDPGQPGAHRTGGGEVTGIGHVDVGDLVVGHGERAGRPRVQVLHPGLGVNPQQARPAQRPVDVHRAARRGDAVLRQRHHGRAPRQASVEQRREHRVQGPGSGRGRRRVGAEPLEVVVEMRHVYQRQVRIVPRHDALSGPADPLRRRDPGTGAPVAEQRERAERSGEPVAQTGRVGVAVRFLAAIGVIDRPRRHRPVDAGAHRVPPAHVGHRVPGTRAPRGVPQLVAAHQRVVLPP